MPFLGKTPQQFVDPEVDIDGGSIDGTAIGATSASTATVTTFTSTGIDDNATSTAITIESGGNVGIGESNPSGIGGGADLAITKSGGARFVLNNSSRKWAIRGDSGIDDLRITARGSVDTVDVDYLTVTSTGNVGIGESAPSSVIHVTSTTPTIRLEDDTDSTYGELVYGGGNLVLRADEGNGAANSVMAFRVDGTERMRIDSSGKLLIGKTASNVSGAVGAEILQNGAFFSTLSGGAGSTNSYHVYNLASNNYVFYANSNGGLYNVQANNVNLSDQRTKKDIVSSGNYLNKLCQIPVRNFRYNYEDDGGKHHLGVISQEVEAVAPELVNKNAFQLDDETTRDAVYTSDLQFAMLKAIQEQQAIIEDLQTRLSALEAN